MRGQTLFEARWILAVLVLCALLMAWLSLWWLVFWGLVILYTLYFFRDPDRPAPADERAVVAAADGVVVEVATIDEVTIVNGPMLRVAIFLSVFDVHTNRAPVAGAITFSERKIGKFLDARHADATRLNECRTWAFENPLAGTIVVRQITGAIARRIVAWKKVGETVAKGERFGMIRFGSRTEIYLPPSAEITVKVGDRVQGGASVIARLR